MADYRAFSPPEQFRAPAQPRSPHIPTDFIFNKLLSASIAMRALQSCQCCPRQFYMQNLSLFPTLSLNFHKNLWYWSRAKFHVSSAGTGEVKNLLQNCEILAWEKMAWLLLNSLWMKSPHWSREITSFWTDAFFSARKIIPHPPPRKTAFLSEEKWWNLVQPWVISSWWHGYFSATA